MQPADVLTITIDRAAGTAVLRKGTWSLTCAIADLPRWRRLYRDLWGRGSRLPNGPGPWARFYAEDLRALEAALEETEHAE